jgi:hypothetical protein
MGDIENFMGVQTTQDVNFQKKYKSLLQWD